MLRNVLTWGGSRSTDLIISSCGSSSSDLGSSLLSAAATCRRTSHPVAARSSWHQNPSYSRPRLGRMGPIFMAASLSQDVTRPIHQDPTKRSPRRCCDDVSDCNSRYAAFNTAPSGTSPSVTKRQTAISSLRARATIEIRRIRPRSLPTRAWNQRLKVLAG